MPVIGPALWNLFLALVPVAMAVGLFTARWGAVRRDRVLAAEG